MTPVRINDILTNPRSASEKETEVLETLTREFPYYNLPHILLAKIYRKNENYKYDQQIKRASLRSLDRKWLYEYIIEGKVEVEVEDKPAAVEKDTVAEDKTEVAKATGTVDTKDKVEEVKMSETPVSTKDISETEAKEEDKTEEVKKPETPVNTKNISETEAKEEDKTEEVKKTETKEGFKETAAPFSLWLQKLSQPSENEIQPRKTSHTSEASVPANHQINKPSNQLTPPPTSPPPKTEDTLSVIDSFLKNNPSISHPKTEFFKAEKVAKKSLELEDDIVTETLANIYAKQGHTEQAVWAYEKLILKFPKKEAYFATLIDELKKE